MRTDHRSGSAATESASSEARRKRHLAGMSLAGKVTATVIVVLALLMAWFGREAFEASRGTLESEIDAFGVGLAKAIAAPGAEAWAVDHGTLARAAEDVVRGSETYGEVLRLRYGIHVDRGMEKPKAKLTADGVVHTSLSSDARAQESSFRRGFDDACTDNAARLRSLIRHWEGNDERSAEIVDAFVLVEGESLALVRANPDAKEFKPTGRSVAYETGGTEGADEVVTDARIVEGRVAGVGPARSYSFPIRDVDGETTHRAFVFLSKNHIEAELAGLRSGILVAMALVVALGGGATFFLTRRMTRPILELVDDAGAVAVGDDHATSVRTTDEIGLLARTMDSMVRRLSAARAERDHEIAEDMHRAMLPEAVPIVPGFDVDVIHRLTDRLGSTFYDFVDLPDRRTGVVVAQSSEDGLAAVLHTMHVGTLLRMEGHRTADPAELLKRVNADARESFREEAHVSMALLVLEPDGKSARVAVSGSPGRVLAVSLPASGGEPRLFASSAPPVGDAPPQSFAVALEIETIDLAEGDRFVLANGRVSELRSDHGHELGEEGFLKFVASSGPAPTKDYVRRLRTALRTFLGKAEVEDDVAIVTVEATPTAE